ncbi:MAG TPA: phosphotransferase [Acidobacteriaceae bacterium]|jgi:hypothetical protein|nr:phosphotransferase [Acidobacteriaceae bacterium]
MPGAEEKRISLKRLRQPSVGSVEINQQNHVHCALTGALGLLANRYVAVSRRAYPGPSPSRFARLLQVISGVRSLLLSAGREKTLVSGEQLEYLVGRLDYCPNASFRRWSSRLSAGRPFFSLPGSNPAESIARITGCDADPAPQLSLSSQRCVVVIMANWHGSPAVLHYAGCDSAIAELERQANGLSLAASSPPISHLVPRLLNHTTLSNGGAILAQERISADPYEFSWRRIDAATDLWLSRSFAAEVRERIQLDKRLDRVCELLPRFADVLLPARDALLQWFEMMQLPRDLAHGDFWLGNVLFHGDTISGIIDWEWARKDGVRAVDGLYLLLMSCANVHEVSITHYLCQLWSGEIDDAALRERISTLAARCGLERNDLNFIALMLWFDLLWQRTVRGGEASVTWSEKMISRTMPSLTIWLSSLSTARRPHAATH